MRIPFRLTIALVAMGSSLAAGPAEESLGELARRDRDRQQRAIQPAKRYTADDIRKAGQGAPAESGSPGGDRGGDITPTSAIDREREQRLALEEKWRKRFDEARQRIKEAESRAWQTVIRPVIVGGSASGLIAGKAVAVPMQVREFVETDELRAARKVLEDLEEELRRSGLPPGWGRER